MSVVQSVLLSAWLLPENGKSHPEPPPASLDECKRERKRNILALLAEDNRADALLVQEAIELHELPIELHVVEDGRNLADENGENRETAQDEMHSLLRNNYQK